MAQYMQLGSGVGTVVGGGAGPEDRGSIRGDLNPIDSEAGMALAIAGVAALLLLVTVGRDARGAGKVVVVGQFVLIVAAASAVGQYAARTWALRHPDSPLAAGISVAL